MTRLPLWLVFLIACGPAQESGPMKPLAGFGSGLTSGGVVIDWDLPNKR